jgi:drug/metabolite transporter (DMT)-like permease
MGYIYMFLFVFQICLQQLLGKFLFTRTPSMTPTQLLFMRSVTSATIFCFLMRFDFKYYLYTIIEKKDFKNIMLRVSTSLLMLVCVYTSVKYLPLVYVSISSNFGPLLTAVFSYFMLKKGLSGVDSMVLLVSFGGVILMITGSLEQDP